MALLLAGAAAVGMQAAHAETVLAQTGLISGSQSFVFSLNAPSAGTFSVQLQDLAWPDRLASLSFAATTATSVIDRLAVSANDLVAESTFKVNHGGSYYALVSGTAQGAFDMGLYSLKVDFAPVPLPAAAWLLLSGFVGFVATQRKRHVASLA
ncbi:MAG TPA: VPLPA-CTERM sorting domain-containing protein [Steroidobacteraceae bacterium]|nr:VPLPA-CTERM sorting domain-containing protein [Steroidobacteraceae bacterium]